MRHTSFVETGRAAPSRDFVLRLAEALDLPVRARNVRRAAETPFHMITSKHDHKLAAINPVT